MALPSFATSLEHKQHCIVWNHCNINILRVLKSNYITIKIVSSSIMKLQINDTFENLTSNEVDRHIFFLVWFIEQNISVRVTHFFVSQTLSISLAMITLIKQYNRVCCSVKSFKISFLEEIFDNSYITELWVRLLALKVRARVRFSHPFSNYATYSRWLEACVEI